MSGRSTKVKGREEGEVDEDTGERRIRSQIAQKVVVGIKENASVHKRCQGGRTKTSWTKFRAKLGLAEKMEVEVLDKYKVEDSKREAFRGRGAP